MMALQSRYLIEQADGFYWVVDPDYPFGHTCRESGVFKAKSQAIFYATTLARIESETGTRYPAGGPGLANALWIAASSRPAG